MRTWTIFVFGALVGIVSIAALRFAPTANAQYLNRLQHVDLDFETNANSSTLTFFDRDSGSVYIYIATGAGNFQFARRLTIQELGGPLLSQTTNPTRNIPKLPTGTE